jgi:hypothetical protein
MIEDAEVLEFEYCRNPWNPNCENSDVEVYILLKGTKIPLCRKCWLAIVEAEVEWHT